MKKIVLFISLALVSLHAEAIRVLIADQIDESLVEVTGPYQLVNPENGKYVGSGTFGKGYSVEPTDMGLRWGEEFPGIYQVTVVPLSTPLANSAILVDGIRYPGVVHIYQVGGKLSLINEVEVDEYLRVTLAREFPKPPSPEVLAAITIAARTTAHYEIERAENAFWHVKAADVNYPGFIPGHSTAAIERAITETRGMALGSFPALWTENCAGATAPYHLMFRHNLATELPGVPSKEAARYRDASSWRVVVPKEWLANLTDLESISGVTLYTDPASHKVYGARFVHHGCGKDVDFFTLQQAIGANRLRSSDFTVEIEEKQVVFSGHGEGHGVGICLLGAEKMAERGQNAADILHHFYPNHRVALIKQKEDSRYRNLARSYARHRR